MVAENTPEEKFVPLQVAQEFANMVEGKQDSKIQQTMNIIKNVSVDDFQKAANYFFLLKSKDPSPDLDTGKLDETGMPYYYYTHSTIENAVNLAKQILYGDELKFFKFIGNRNFQKALSTVEIILNNITNSNGIEKKISDDFGKFVNIFFKRKSKEEIVNSDKNIETEKISDRAQILINKIDIQQKNFTQTKKEIEQKTEEALGKFEQKTQGYLKELQEQANLNIFANEAEIFDKTANDYRQRSNFFLISAGVSLLFLFGTALFLLETHYIITEITVGGTLLSILSLTALAICLRGYFVNSHNEAHNRHRSNVLRSYKNIYDNAAEPNKKEVVTQTLNAAFQQLPTGFSKQQSDSGSGDFSRLVSLFKRS